MQDERWPSVRPLPGAIKLVKHLHAHKVPMALATGSQRRNFELKSSHLGELFDCFEGRVVCADDGLIERGRGKPHPDIFLVAAERFLKLDVGQGEVQEGHVNERQKEVRATGLVFEDGVPGVQAGKRAGMSGMYAGCAGFIGRLHARPEELIMLLQWYGSLMRTCWLLVERQRHWQRMSSRTSH